MSISHLAIIDPTAVIADDVTIGPWSSVGAHACIGAGTVIDAHVTVGDYTTLGNNNHCFSYSSIGSKAQTLDNKSSHTALLKIGNNNVFREFCTVNRGSTAGSATVIGDHNLLMAYAHVAHDCLLADHTVFANHATVAGHAHVGSYAILSGFVAVAQYCRVGAYAFLGGAAKIGQDLLPMMLGVGTPCDVLNINIIGLRRHGFDSQVRAQLKEAYLKIYRQHQPLHEVLAWLREGQSAVPVYRYLADAIEQRSRSGILR